LKEVNENWINSNVFRLAYAQSGILKPERFEVILDTAILSPLPTNLY